jgi:hypothetical protein
MKVLFFQTLFMFAVVGLSPLVHAQVSVGVTPDMRIAANDAYQKKDWQAAVKAYEKILSLEDRNAGARYRYGMALLNLNRNEEARANFEAAMSITPNSVFALGLARSYARSGNKEKLYELFERTITLGGIAAESLNDENDFASIKAEPKFAQYVKKLDAAANPCRSQPEFRQFDFWIGEWLPRNAQGLTVGTSSIQLILGSCIIFENWSTPVSAGKSFNLFDTRDGKWHQTWVDDKGRMTHYVGGLVDGKMVLDSESVVNGKKTIARMTFSRLENGDVRQHGENSTDNGKTWITSFDFIYVKKK